VHGPRTLAALPLIDQPLLSRPRRLPHVCTPGVTVIPLSVPCIRGNAWSYVKECLDSEWVSSAGTYVSEFEQAFARYVGAKRAVACVNGTAALHVALRLAGVGADDLVLVPTVTFIAPVHAARYLGAEPVFMDCDEYYNIDVAKVASYLETQCDRRAGGVIERASGRRVAAVVPVHVFGNAVAMDDLAATCERFALPIVEDATEALGTRYTSGAFAGRHPGTIGLAGCCSFNGNKIITCGGGGMIVFDDDALADRAKYLTTQAKDDEVRFVHGDVGYNYRLTNLQAALGVSQMELLPQFLETKRAHYAAYRAELNAVPGLRVADVPPYAENNCWMIALQIDAAVYGRDRETVMADLARQDIQTRPLWFLNHLQPPYAKARAWEIARAPRMLERTLNIPCSVGLSAEDLCTVVNALTT
jgi:aminotransferase in exopolysaccharide biosynthesis